MKQSVYLIALTSSLAACAAIPPGYEEVDPRLLGAEVSGAQFTDRKVAICGRYISAQEFASSLPKEEGRVISALIPRESAAPILFVSLPASASPNIFTELSQLDFYCVLSDGDFDFSGPQTVVRASQWTDSR